MRLLVLLLLMLYIGYSQQEKSDYVVNKSDGHAYKIMYKGESWQIAREICKRDGAKLAVPKTKNEFFFIQKVVRDMDLKKITEVQNHVLVWLGVSNLEDYRVWRNVDGEDIKETGFHEWVTNYAQESWPGPAEPHCAGMDAINPGLREFWCHLAQPYICEKIVTVD